MTKDKETIFIAIPILQAKQSEELATLRELCAGLNHDPLHPFRYISGVVNDKSGVAYARNCLVGKFLQTKASRIWYWDYDVAPSANCFDLLHVDADIVGGMYPLKRREFEREIRLMFPALFRNDDGSYRMFVPDGPRDSPILECDAVAMGSTVIRREVLENPDMRLGDDSHCDSPAIFRTPLDVNGKTLSTEDIDFCERAKGLGYSIKVKLDVVGGHRKVIDLNLLWHTIESSFNKGREYEKGIRNGTAKNVPVGVA